MLFTLSAFQTGHAVAQERHVEPNYGQAALYSPAYVRQFVYSSRVTPNWIGETDEFWYSYRNSTGTHYFRVHPEKAIKQPLFDRVVLAAQLSQAIQKPLDPAQLSLSQAKLDDEGKIFSFVYDKKNFEFSLESEQLTEASSEPASSSSDEIRQGMSREEIIAIMRRRQQSGLSRNGSQSRNSHRAFSPDRKSYVFALGHDLYYVDVPEEMLKEAFEKAEKSKEDAEKDSEESDEQDQSDKKDGEEEEQDKDVTEEKEDEKQDSDKSEQDEKKSKQSETGKEEDKKSDEEEEQEQVEKKDETEEKQEDDTDADTDANEAGEADAEEEDKELPIPDLDKELDDKAVRLTEDGEEDYTFAQSRRSRRGGSQQTQTITDETKTRPSVSWSDDSTAFYVTRRDTRNVDQLWVINSLAEPRPTLESYDYPMPGEEHIRTSELYTYSRHTKKLIRTEPKWVDESYTNLTWGKTGNELRVLRRDRLLRGVEYCTVDTETGKTTSLIEERFANANLAPQSVRYLEETDEIIWWSERSGWAHYYLYGRDGKLKNAITSGEFRVSSIVAIDEDNRTLYVRGNGREEGENVYLEHLYSVRFDGTGLQLMDPGNAYHRSILSPTKRFLVDNCSRVDMPPISVLRQANGTKVMDLETSDMSRLKEIGWQVPETFVVKAADGVTDLYGNMWKPFDFDPSKKYPIIAHVYPGPQTEGTRHDFTAIASEQQLAQVGFIVIQVGHRGGAPTRSKAYGAFGYFNLRDYGLADKKAAIEQLAQRFDYVDLERVGLYGHSGGGFMTAAAMLKEPYNDFFKVGVSTAGNHDNNIYNNSWSERYHGLREVKEKVESKSKKSETESGKTKGSEEREQDEKKEESSQAYDYFYEYELRNDDDEHSLDRWNHQAWWDDEAPFNLSQMPLPTVAQEGTTQEETKQEQEKVEQDETKQEKTGQDSSERRGSRGRRQRQGLEQDKEGQKEEKSTQEDEKGKDGQEEKDIDKEDVEDKKQETEKEEEQEQEEDQQETEKEKEQDKKEETKIKFEIEVPTNAELAENLKGHLFLIHGELDNNVHPANTLRLVDALIEANKRFDMLYLPATRHGFGKYQPYVNQRMYEYFAEHLLDDYQSGADIGDKNVFGGGTR